MDTAPRIEQRCVCIATNAQVVLAAVVSSYFQTDGVYFPVFEFPPIDTPYSPSCQLGKDGYFAHILGTRAAIAINNALARIHPEVILFLGLTEAQQSYLRAILPSQKLIEINSVDDFLKRLTSAELQADRIASKSSQIIEGLLLAKFTHKRLVIDESAPPLQETYLRRGEGMVLIENAGSLDDVAAVNYAFAIDADVVLVPPVDREEIRLLPRQLHDWGNDHSHAAFHEVRRMISARIKCINFLQYRFATFFTVGLPYGLSIKNIIPCSHVMKDVNCGVLIANTIIEEHNPMNFGSALVFSPQQFATEETDDVCTLLDDNNYIIKQLLGKNATVKQIENYGSHFPFDVMHICAHGGETDGYYVIQTFDDRQGNQHKLEFYEIVGFSPSGGDMVHVTRKALFAKLDDYAWRSQRLESYPKYVFEDMMKALKDEGDRPSGVIRSKVNAPIATSCHIQCYDSIHQGSFDSLAGFGCPIVFNNTCSSSHEMAAMIIGAGARAYVGTLWSVGNATATQAAKVFYKEALRQGKALAAYSEMNKSIRDKHDQNVYIFWGLHFVSFRTPPKKSDERIFLALVATYFMWLKKIATAADPEVKRNSLPIAKFLLDEIVTRFPDDRLREIRDFDPGAVEDYERSLPAAQGEDFCRGVTEMEISERRPYP
ncbi:MAG: hypothetical protein ABSC21_11760 [Terriglobia bacterium]|jgi:hypothetical protein